MYTLDEFEADRRRDALRIRSLARRMDNASDMRMAMATALSEHPVVSYVKGLPVESPSYPAILYLKQSSDARRSTPSGNDVESRGTGNGVETQGTGNDIEPQGTGNSVREGYVIPGEEFLREREIVNDPSYQGRGLYESVSLSNVINGSSDIIIKTGKEAEQFRKEHGIEACDLEYITWVMPGHDIDRPKERGCSFIRSSSGNGLVYTACPHDKEHHIKAKKKHCWSLRCPMCMNDTALKRAVSIERQLLTFSRLKEKQGVDVGDIGHWVVSPPQEFAKSMMQTSDEFDLLSKYIGDSLIVHGASAGVTVFHPWRQQDDMWKLSPHFHSLCYGHIDTTRFRKDNPGWVIKKVHPRERIRSIRQSVAYLMTHMGIGVSEVDPDDVDWEEKVLNHFIPGITSKDAKYSDKDFEDSLLGKGRMVGDCRDIDWLQFTEEELQKELRIRLWGGVSRNNIRNVGLFRQYKLRVCTECGELLRTYDGHDDTSGELVRYIADNRIMAFRQDAIFVSTLFAKYKSRLRDADMTVIELVRMIPQAVSTLELDLPKNDDIVLDGPFDRPDEYYLRRQRIAFGPDAEA